MSATRITNNQIATSTITAQNIQSGTLVGSLFNQNLTLNSNVTISGNLNVMGNTATINATNTYINDPLVVFNNGYTGSLTGYDIGIVVNRNLASLAPYGSVNTFLGWVESDQAFEALATTSTGGNVQSINSSGFANVKVGNVTSVSETITGTLAVTGATTFTTALGSSLQVAAIGNVTPGTAVFTTQTTDGLQAVAIGNVTPGSAVFTNANATIANVTGTTSSTSTTTGALVVAGGVGVAGALNTGANISIGGSTPGLVTASGSNKDLIIHPDGTGNVYISANTYINYPTISTSTTTGALQVGGGAGILGNLNIGGGLQTPAIGNVTPGTAVFTTVNTSGNIVANSSAGSLTIYGNAISSNTGKINFGSISNVQIAGGSNGYTITTDGNGNLSFSSLLGNNILLGSNVSGQLVSNAVSLTTTTDITDAITQLNAILGKLTPASPPNFPATTLTQSTGTVSGLMTNFAQTDNSGWGNLSVSGGTAVNAVRVATFATSTVTNSGTTPSGGNIQLYINGTVIGNNYHALTSSPTSADNGTYGNLVVSSVQDYHNIVSTVAAGFWNVFSASIAATSIPAGWNRANIFYTGDGAATPTLTWYYDSSTPTAPAFSGTSIALTSNTVTYSSTIPHLNSSAGFTLNGTVQNLSGDMYYSGWSSTSANFFSGLGAGGALLAPANRTLSQVGVPVPLTRNNTSAYSFSTTSNVTTGFGSASAATGPTLNVSTPYATTGSGQFAPGNIILYKTGTTTQIEETSLTSSFGTAARIVNPDGGTAADNPAYTGTETTFNSATSTLLATDATVVAAKLQYDVTNYSTGYYPVGPNLSSGRSASQYFTFKFNYAALSSFYIHYTGTIAGLWIACPGVTDTPASPTNGWLNASVAYAGSGVPGTGTGGNGSNGCAVGGTATLNSNGTYNINVTFGSVNTSSAGNKSNEVYVRVKLTSGQSLTVLNAQAS